MNTTGAAVRSGNVAKKQQITHIPEHVHAVNLMRWVRLMQGQHPVLRLFHAIPNGGARSKATAGKLKAEGALAGVLDYCLPAARGPWHGLYLELKAEGGRPSPKQRTFAEGVLGEGYAAVFCTGWDDAARALDEYLAMGPFTGQEAA